MLNCVQLFATPWTVACQALLSMGFSRQGYLSGLPFLSKGSSHPGTEPTSPAVEAPNLNHWTIKGPSLVAQMVKKPPAIKIWVRSLGW